MLRHGKTARVFLVILQLALLHVTVEAADFLVEDFYELPSQTHLTQVFVESGRVVDQLVVKSTGENYTGWIQVAIDNRRFDATVQNGSLSGLHAYGHPYTGMAWVHVPNRQLSTGGASNGLYSGGNADGTLKWTVKNGIVTYSVPGGFLPGNEYLRDKYDPNARPQTGRRVRGPLYNNHRDDGAREIYHKGELGILYRGIFVSWHTIAAVAASSVKPSLYNKKIQIFRKRISTSRSLAAGQRQRALAAAPVVVRYVVVPVITSVATELILEKYNEYQEAKREEMLASPIPPSDVDRQVFGSAHKSHQQKIKDRTDWMHYQRIYYPQKAKRFKGLDPHNDVTYKMYRQHALRTCYLPDDMWFPWIPPETPRKITRGKITLKKPSDEQRKRIEHNRNHYNKKLRAMNEARKNAGLPSLKKVEVGKKPPRIKDINGVPSRMHGKGPGGVPE